MNLGLRDAVFLAPIIIDHLKRSEGETSLAKLRTCDEATLKVWAADRHAKALKVIKLAKNLLKVATWKDETTWYLGCLPINWVQVRNLVMWIGHWTGMSRKVPWALSGLQNR